MSPPTSSLQMLTKALPFPKFTYFRDMIMGDQKVQTHFDKTILATHITVGVQANQMGPASNALPTPTTGPPGKKLGTLKKWLSSVIFRSSSHSIIKSGIIFSIAFFFFLFCALTLPINRGFSSCGSASSSRSKGTVTIISTVKPSIKNYRRPMETITTHWKTITNYDILNGNTSIKILFASPDFLKEWFTITYNKESLMWFSLESLIDGVSLHAPGRKSDLA